MRTLKPLLFVGFLFYASKVCLYGAGFELPAGTPGLQAAQPDARLVYVIVPGTNIELCFPTDGSQPTTERAGLWSSARYVGRPNDNLATDWWVRIFGGTQAVIHSRNGLDPYADPPMGFDANNNPAHIISVNTNGQGTPQNFEQQFWQDFREIAADPVGRVLLYRLLIEIRRIDNTGHGCCGDDVVLLVRRYLDERNNYRNIEITRTNNGCAFSPVNRAIMFDLRDIQTLTLHSNPIKGWMAGQPEGRPRHVALFHEIIHWFHCLRNIVRVSENSGKTADSFKYAMRCYYGDQSELCAWGTNCNSEEIATILGAPNYNRADHLALIPTNAYFSSLNKPRNCIAIYHNKVQSYIPRSERFLNGDDLSENAYRCSKGLHMRFGHASRPANPVSLLEPPLHYQLSHKVAADCYAGITGHLPTDWRLITGEAISR